MSTPPPSPRRPCVITLALLVAGAVLAGCTAGTPTTPTSTTRAHDGGDHQRSDGTEIELTVGEPRTEPIEVTDTGHPVELAGEGVVVSFELASRDEQAPGRVMLTQHRIAAASLPPELAPMSDYVVVELPPGTELASPAEITFELPPDFDEGSHYPVVVWEHEGSHRVLPAEWSPGDTEITAYTDHFSGGFLGSIDVGRLIEDLSSRLGNYLTGRSGASPPTCDNENGVRERGVTVESDGGDAVMWCVGEEDGGLVLRITNNRRAYVEVSYPESWSVVDGGSFGLSVEAVNRLVSDTAAELVAGPGRDVRLVAGGETVTLALREGDWGRARVEMSVTAWLIGAMVFGVDVYASAASIVSSGLGGAAQGSWGRMSGALERGESPGWLSAAQSCLRSFTDHLTDGPLGADVALPVAKFVWGCLPDIMSAELSASGYSMFLMGLVLRTVGAITSTVLTALNLVISGLREIWDSFASLGGDSDVFYDIAIGAELPPWTERPVGGPLVDDGRAVMLVMDTSGSMSGRGSDGRTRIEWARASMLNFLEQAELDTVLGLRTFPGSGGSCGPGSLRFAPAPRDPQTMAAIIRSVAPDGDTPTAEALAAAADDLVQAGATTGTIVLVSDGGSTCAPPCPVAERIASSGISIQVDTIGLAASGRAREELECIAAATGGRYADATEPHELEALLDQHSRARLTIELSYPRTAIAEFGSGGGTVTINATIENPSPLAARDVRVMLRFDDGAASVVAPVRWLGTLDPGTSRTIEWTFRPALTLTGQTVEFEAATTSPGLSDAPSARGAISIADALDREDAGGVLGGLERVVILGDSFSSGEGTGSYLEGTDTTANRCHRSLDTYLASVFELPPDAILACSGAVANDLVAPDGGGRPSQAAQLDRWQAEHGAADAVLLTIGGNDAGFSSIVVSCLLSPVPCNERIFTSRTGDYLGERLDALPATLVDAYRGVDAVLNRQDRIDQRDGRQAPIVVLAYPRIVPGSSSAGFCSAVTTMSQGELVMTSQLVTDLNGAVEAAVLAGRELGLPVYFVPNVEDAFLPSNTICDGRRAFVRSPETIRLGPSNETLLQILVGRTGSDRWRAFEGDNARRIQELFHPNEDGYRAMSQAVLRWSASDAAAEPFPDRPARPPDALRVDGSGHAASTLVVGEQWPTLQADTTYALQAQGFAPGAPVEVTARSTVRVLAIGHADETGDLDVLVTLTGLAAGDHELSVASFAPDGTPILLDQPFTVGTARALPLAIATGGFGLVVALIGLFLVRRRTPRPAA